MTAGGTSRIDLRSIARRPGRYRRARAWTLFGVWLFFALHFLHWKLSGTTLAPLELHEVMYTAELGVITAGFILMALALVSVLVFGRFFCSWGCHVLALEDGSAWILKKLRIRPRFVRARLLAFIPMAALVYMFIWPHVARWIGKTWPGAVSVVGVRPEPHYFRVITDAEGWASFVTTNFWRNLPGPGIAFLTLAVCGFAVVLFLGSRSFCAYACPYGALFGLADRVAPGRITLAGDCDGCAACTAVCPSHIRVHEEIQTHAMITDPSCIKGLGCVSACPTGVLKFGFTRPPLVRALDRLRGKQASDPGPSFRDSFREWRSGARYDFTMTEEVLALGTFLATLIVFRDLYALVPFLMTLGLGIILGFVAVMTVRLATRRDVALGPRGLRTSGRLTRAGWGYAIFATAVAALVIHSAWIRWNEHAAGRDLAEVESMRRAGTRPPDALVASARRHLETLDRWGLVEPAGLRRSLASVYLVSGPPELAEAALRRVLEKDAGDSEVRLELASLLADRGNYAEAASELRRVIERHPNAAAAHYNLGLMLALLGDPRGAAASYREAIRWNPDDPQAHNNLGVLLARTGDAGAAESELRRAIELAPDYADPHFNLAGILAGRGDAALAQAEFRRAGELDPRYRDAAPPPAAH